jgi:hypothetical protein
MSEEPLTPPPAATHAGPAAALWIVVAQNERINRDWEALIKAAAANTAKCYDYLRSTPMLRRPGRIFRYVGRSMLEPGSTN